MHWSTGFPFCRGDTSMLDPELRWGRACGVGCTTLPSPAVAGGGGALSSRWGVGCTIFPVPRDEMAPLGGRLSRPCGFGCGIEGVVVREKGRLPSSCGLGCRPWCCWGFIWLDADGVVAARSAAAQSSGSSKSSSMPGTSTEASGVFRENSTGFEGGSLTLFRSRCRHPRVGCSAGSVHAIGR